MYWIRTQTRKTIRLKFNEAQVKLYEAHKWFRDHRMPVRITICKARRAGLSTGVESLVFDDTTTHPHTDSLIVSHQLNPSENVLGMCKVFWDHMPQKLRFKFSTGDEIVNVRPPMHPKYSGELPTDKIEFAPPLSSRIFIATSRSVDAYRSFAFQNLHATEVAYYPDAGSLFAALIATVPMEPETAIYMESTPNGMGGPGEWFYETCIKADMRGADPEFGENKLVFIPWHELVKSFSRPFDSEENKARFRNKLDEHEKDLLKQFPHITLEQLNWRRARIAQPDFENDEEVFYQEYPESLTTAFLASGSMVFSRASMQKLSLNTERPLWQGDVYWGDSDAQNVYDSPYNTVRRPKFLSPGKADSQGFKPHGVKSNGDNLSVWRWPERGERIVIGADIAKGNPLSKDADYSAICVLVLNELEPDELIMTWRGRINTIDFGDVLSALAWAIRYNVGDKVVAPILAPEWTGPGTATCTYIDQRKLYPLWHYRMPGVEGFPPSKHVGWESNGKTKPFAVNAMVKAVENGMVRIYSKDLVQEMASYRQQGALADEASFGGVGAHDDLVSAFQIANAICRFEAMIDPQAGDESFAVNLDEIPTGDSGGMRVEPFDEFEAMAAFPRSEQVLNDAADAFNELDFSEREYY